MDMTTEVMNMDLTNETVRTYPLEKDISTQAVAYALAEYLDLEKNMITQTVRNRNGYLIQCKGDASAEWTKYLGMDAAVSIRLTQQDGTLSVAIGFERWMEKLGIAAVGAIFLQPLLLTTGIGILRQITLPQEIFTFIEHYLYPDGNVPQPERFRPEEEPAEETCPVCGASVRPGAAFCTSCGANLEEARAEKTCPVCGAVLQGDEVFCPKCGHHLAE